MNSGHLTTLFRKKIGNHFTTETCGGRETNGPLDNHTDTFRGKSERWGGRGEAFPCPETKKNRQLLMSMCSVYVGRLGGGKKRERETKKE